MLLFIVFTLIYGQAIRCENIMPSSSSIINIWENEIYNNAMGIHVRNIDGALINYNNYNTTISNDDLAILGTPHFGIWLENSANSEIDNNTISRNNAGTNHVSGAIEEDYFMGISTDNSPFTDVINNSTFNMGTDIKLLDYCISSEIRCNDMTSSYRGIYFENATFLAGLSNHYGDVDDATGNSWNGNYMNTINPNFRITGYFSNTPIAIDWYHDGNLDALNINCPFYHSNAIIPVSNATGQECPHLPDEGEQSSFRQNIKDATLNNIQYEEFVTENRFIEDKSGFEVAKNEPTLLQGFGSLQTIINNWYAGQQQGNVGKFKAVKDYVNANFIPAAQNASLGITGNDLHIQNLNVVLRIYFEHFDDIDAAPLDENDRLELENIAYQGVIEGGEAVYMARAMLKIDIIDFHNSGSRNSGITKPTSDKQEKCTIVPNPATNSCFVSFTTPVDHIEVMDLIGNQSFIYKVQDDQLQYILDLSNYSSGMYALRLLKDTRVLFKEKLVVIK